MKRLFTDIFNLISTLRWVDFVFMLLVILLIVTFITIIYLIKLNKQEIIKEEIEKEEEEFNLESVTKQIEDEYDTLNIIKPNSFENEQEEQAIISYDELLSSTGEFHLEYDEDYGDNPEIEIKKVKKAVHINEPPKIEESVNDYSKEEDFLKKLNDLKSKLS